MKGDREISERKVGKKFTIIYIKYTKFTIIS